MSLLKAKEALSLEKAVSNALAMIGSSMEYPSSFYPRSSGRFWPLWRDLEQGSPGVLLDIGCGVGFMSAVVSQIGYAVDCLDASNNLKEEVIQQFNLKFSECNVESAPIPYPDNTFDVVLLTEVLEHFNYNPLVPLYEIRRVLKPGGKLFLTTPNMASIFALYTILMGDNVSGNLNQVLGRGWQKQYGQHQVFRDMHFRYYTIKDVRQLMQIAGFSIIKYRSLVRGDPATRNLPRRLFLYLAKTIVASTNSRIWGDTVYVIAKKVERANQPPAENVPSTKIEK
jgi:ubiquinone/menaquinone biosynthesis C-methylase UbiE